MSARSQLRLILDRPLLHCLALVILFTASTRLDPLSSTVLDPDIWWHLRDGNFILAQHTIPHSGLFTEYSSHAWVDYSWGSEICMALFHRWFGLMGLVALRSTIEVAITLILFLWLRRGLHSFWQALALAAVGMWAIHHCLGMQPMLFSILMFSIELSLIFRARQTNAIGPLYWMPLLFLVWANLHIQFIYGLFALVLLAVSALAVRLFPGNWSEGIPLAKASDRIIGIAATSFLATLIGPNSWQLYVVIFRYLRSSAPYMIITELQALSFRVPGHFIVLAIVGAAFFVVGWRRSRDPFVIALLSVGTVVGFRMSRDSWFCCLPALLIVSEREWLATVQAKSATLVKRVVFAMATAVFTLGMFILIATDSKTSNATLSWLVAAEYPVNAANFLKSHSVTGPIYNDMDWGGFLIWDLPDVPVAIDNRPDLYGDDTLSRDYFVQQGKLDWKNDNDLTAARTVLLNRQTPLAELLAKDDHYRVIYEDPLAVVLSRSELMAKTAGNYESAEQKLTK